MAVDTTDFVGPLLFAPKTSSDQLWSTTPGIPLVEGKPSYIHPVSYTPVTLDETKLIESLSQAPLEFTAVAKASAVELSLPTPDGGFAKFKVVSSPIMEPGLAAQFPEIQTYSGQGVDDPAATLRFDVTPAGFHAQVLSPLGPYYIDPYWHLDSSAYISYYKRDLMRSADRPFVEEEAGEHDHEQSELTVTKRESEGVQSKGSIQLQKDPGGPLQRSGSKLKSYRLANAATGEYTAFCGGSVTIAQSCIVTAINRVNGIYENELSVRLTLVANNSLLVYTSTADPYTNNSGVTMLGENQTNVDAIIGSANYDIGHVFSTGGGGIAGVGVVGKAGSKARGVTGRSAPVADAFYVDYVAHEMGHQFGGNHTFNSTTSSCGGGNRNASTAYEPGSGSTIQAYGGNCGADNLQSNSDPYFHSASFDEIIGYISQGPGLTSATIVNTGNSVPRVSAGPDYTIPAQTPFALKAAGEDSDDASYLLTYNWEQRDLGASITLTAADNGTSPILRSFYPTLSTDRVVPRLAQLLNNTTPVGEKLPTVARTMKFRATVRDNRSGGGGVNTDDISVNVIATGAAFAVTSPNTAVSWAAESSQTVTWDVAGTTAAPISTTSVNIWLSTDGGLTFPIQLASGVANDGSETLVIPNIVTTQARIKVEPTNSIYFDLSNANFTITGGTGTAPVISTLRNRVIDMNTSTGSMAFTVSDFQTPPQNLFVTATSSDLTLMPASGIVLDGSDVNRTLTLTPAPGQFGATTIFVNVTDFSGLTTTATFQLYVRAVGPTDLAISQSSITENSPVNTMIGTLSTVDANAGDTFVYSLIAGSGDTDNSSFTISGNQLRIATSPNFETKNSYSIRIRSTDAGGLFFDKSLSISVVDLAELSAPVQIGDGTAQRSAVKNVVLTFDGTVTIAPGAFVVDKLGTGGGAVTTSTATTVNGAGQTLATLSFSGSFTRGTAGLLIDGYYRLTIDGTKVTRGGQQLDLNGDGIGGDTLTIGSVEADNFFAQFGDTTGDGLVSVAEFGQFRTSFGKSSADIGFDTRYDFEGDAAINVSDFGQFRSRFGKPKMTF